jgi:hypothetical protein
MIKNANFASLFNRGSAAPERRGARISPHLLEAGKISLARPALKLSYSRWQREIGQAEHARGAGSSQTEPANPRRATAINEGSLLAAAAISEGSLLEAAAVTVSLIPYRPG